MFDVSIINDLLWTGLAFATTLSMVWTLFRKRDVKLDKRVMLMLFGMILVWTGNFLIPMENFFDLTDLWISTALILFGGLINIQIMLEWKHGRYAWLKVLGLVVASVLIVYGILNLIV